MINQGHMLYRSLKNFSGNSPMFPIGIQVDSSNEEGLWEILEIIEEEYNGIPIRCFKNLVIPYPVRRWSMMVCFRQQDLVHAMKFRMRLSNDL